MLLCATEFRGDMIRQEFLPPEPTAHPYSPICEPANEHASDRPCLAYHAIGHELKTHSQHQFVNKELTPLNY